MANLYRPRMQRQGDPSDSGGTGWFDCGPHSIAMGQDAVTHGAVVPTGHGIRELTNEPAPQPGDPGVNHAQLVAATKRYGGRWSEKVGAWAALQASLKANRWVCVSTWYPLMGAYRAQKPGEFGHEIGLMAVGTPGTTTLVYDPLAKAARWVPLATVRAAAEEWGRRNGAPGKCLYIVSLDAIPYA